MSRTNTGVTGVHVTEAQGPRVHQSPVDGYVVLGTMYGRCTLALPGGRRGPLRDGPCSAAGGWVAGNRRRRRASVCWSLVNNVEGEGVWWAAPDGRLTVLEEEGGREAVRQPQPLPLWWAGLASHSHATNTVLPEKNNSIFATIPSSRRWDVAPTDVPESWDCCRFLLLEQGGSAHARGGGHHGNKAAYFCRSSRPF